MKRIQITIKVDGDKVPFPQIEFSRKVSKEERKELMDDLSFDLFCLYKKVKKHAKKTNKKKSRSKQIAV